MHQDYIIADPWSIIEEGFYADRVKSSESLFALGNGAMGQRANFEERYTGPTFQGSYIGGVYYPDKTKVGWWKNGYPEYFAKVLNAPSWIGIDIVINGEALDLHTVKNVTRFRREFNMREGWYHRSFAVEMQNGLQVEVEVRRFLCMELDEAGVIRYQIKVLNAAAAIDFSPYVDAGVQNEDANWEEKFWEPLHVHADNNTGYVTARTFKTHYTATTFMHNAVYINNENAALEPEVEEQTADFLQQTYRVNVEANQEVTFEKIGGYTSSLNHQDTQSAAATVIAKATAIGYQGLLEQQIAAWNNVWEMSDIVIQGDVKAQQGIRFNIFQLNQTYSGKDTRLNIGPKGFTGEKYGGSTYWDTEAYCIPFYMATKNQEVARNLLTYRYNQLDKAIENAEKLGFTNGAALYPMVTMTGEECHNEWEITFEEIHRNAAIVFAIYNYTRFTADHSYIPEKGLEVIMGVARFWKQRVNYSTDKKQYVILGVTGPNEYENNVNNNFCTNYCAQWCLQYAIEQYNWVKTNYPTDFARIQAKINVTDTELEKMAEIASNMYFPFDATRQIFLQQDSFLDKDLTPVAQLDRSQRPINQKWSWDRILRSPYIKQADTLQAFYYFEDQFTAEQLERHFDFYESFTVHESSLSPCVHSIQAAALDKMDMAYTFYLRTSRLDLDDYNKEVEEGCHITSMAGTWMSIVEGFGGMRIRNNQLQFQTRLPKEWEAYSFKINFRNQIVKVHVAQTGTTLTLETGSELQAMVNQTPIALTTGQSRTV